ncbi:tRNA dihydrouridine synthase DusB [Scatolibacter rhodanostii]|uniref:tRNA dihydrouridine synthase DusB n=1 Tax=Scatolibacter rhodanostii TaxID=2014781 RepID=UPI000C087984|nr:tRNA dihydrouridine synthase DusB [Scatolibacter rhodanostii]
MKIGKIKLKGKAILAPMAGVTDFAYREICMQMGAGYAVTEMVSAKALEYEDKKSFHIAELDDKTRPVAIQIFGDEPKTMALAAKKLMKYRPDAIDINMGCPVPKIAGNRSGSALMKHPELCGEIVAAIHKAVDVPVTVKIRKGWDENLINAPAVAKICEQAGAAAIAVHGRTKMQMYTGQADWNSIKAVKQAVEIPVIGNGDVTSGEKAAQMLKDTGCDFVMVGRAAMGNPWIFDDINQYLKAGTPAVKPTLDERIAVIKKHIETLCGRNGENRGMREARKHVAWYFFGLKGAAECRRRAGELSVLDDLYRLLDDVYRMNQEE